MAKNSVKTEGALDQSVRNIINNNFRDVSVVTTQTSVTSSTTLVDVAGLVTDELEPGTYTFNIRLGVSSGASGGLKVAFKQSVSSMLTSIEYDSQAFAAAAVAAIRGTTTTDETSIIASTSAVVSAVVFGTVVVAKKGTLQLRMAQNASNGTATIVVVGSMMEFTRVTTG